MARGFVSYARSRRMVRRRKTQIIQSPKNMPTSAIPASDSSFLEWLNNFQMKLGGYAPTFGISAAEVTQAGNDYTLLNYLLNQINALDNDGQSRTAYKNLILKGAIGSAAGTYPALPTFGAVPTAVPVGIRARCVSLVARIKANTACTDAIAQDLDIVAPASTFDAATFQPVISAKLTASLEVTVTFNKASGQIDGVNVYVRLQGQSAWKKLAFDSVSPYVDNSPLAVAGTPEVREYRVRAVLNDVEIGVPSDTVQVTVS
jgi:hypothetical protein